MRLLGLEAIYQEPRTSDPQPAHRIYPYLLRGMAITRANQVWCSDITYIPVQHGFLYLVAIMDWATRYVLAWRLSNTMDTRFCLEGLNEALARYGKPKIFNTDQGSQFTSLAFNGALKGAGVAISMDNIFIERLWRSLKYESVYLHEMTDGFVAERVIADWLGFYNTERPHLFLDGQTPLEAYHRGQPVDMMGKPSGLPTYPPAQQQQKYDINLKKNLAVSSDNGIHLKQAVKLSNNLEPPQKLNQGWRVCHGLSPGHCVNCYEQLDNAWSPDGETGSRSPTAHHLGIAFHIGSTQK